MKVDLRINNVQCSVLFSSIKFNANLSEQLIKTWQCLFILMHTLDFSLDVGQWLEMLINPPPQHRHCSPEFETSSSLHFSWIP